MELFSSSASKKRRHSEDYTKSEYVDSALQEFRRSLPVYKFKKELVHSILHHHADNKVVLIVAETGSGKSTQIPAYFLNSSHRIAVTQPRRVAAMTLARRVAYEAGNAKVGKQVGYRVRFDDCTSSDTQLVYVTDGMLLREAMVDPLLKKYSVVFLDEAHERSLQTDILLGVVQRARKARSSAAESNSRRILPLKVVVMSATLQTNMFETFFGKECVNIITVPGRTFPVQLLYAAVPIQDDYLEATLSTIMQIHDNEEPGDILAFLPGQEEIEDLAALLRKQLEQDQQFADQWTGDRVEVIQDLKSHASQQLINGVMICQLYAALPPEAQMAAFQDKPPGCRRKIILATNIAETSVTLPEIRYVVDPGKHKCRQVNPTTGMESLTVEAISQAQAAQRAGRAGRVQAGICFRLYTEQTFLEQLDEESVPDILRVNLSQVVLQLKGMGIKDPTAFEFVTKPDMSNLVRATKVLFALGALDDDMDLTEYGKKLAKLPLDPVFGHLLLQSVQYSCVKEMLTVVSVLSAENLFYRPAGEGGVAAKAAAAHKRFVVHEGDLPTFLTVYSAWEREAVYFPPGAGGIKAQRKRLKSDQGQGRQPKLLHGEWCLRNYVSGRSLARAFHVREQLKALCTRQKSQNGLEMDVNLSYEKNYESFLKCIAAGLFLQVASRVKAESEDFASKGRSGSLGPSRGRYKTKVGNAMVSIHPTSAMFGRQPAPACVVYTELVTTKKTYIRGVTQIREDWLHDVAPKFYSR